MDICVWGMCAHVFYGLQHIVNFVEAWISILPLGDSIKWEDLGQRSPAGPPSICTSAEPCFPMVSCMVTLMKSHVTGFYSEITCYCGAWVSKKVSETHLQQMPRADCTLGECFFFYLDHMLSFFHLYHCNMEAHRCLINLVCYLV